MSDYDEPLRVYRKRVELVADIATRLLVAQIRQDSRDREVTFSIETMQAEASRLAERIVAEAEIDSEPEAIRSIHRELRERPSFPPRGKRAGGDETTK